MTIRHLGSVLPAAGITALLFWTMTALIVIEELVVLVDPPPLVPWVEVRPDRPPEKIVRKPSDRPAPPEPLEVPIDPTPRAEPLHIPIHPEGSTVDPRAGQELWTGPGSTDGDAVPLVRVPPRYPRIALARGLEGRVLVEFTITASGTVRDARVIASEMGRALDHSSGNAFEQAALEAVRQWRYTPKVVRGIAVERPGMRIVIPFRRVTGESR